MFLAARASEFCCKASHLPAIGWSAIHPSPYVFEYEDSNDLCLPSAVGMGMNLVWLWRPFVAVTLQRFCLRAFVEGSEYALGFGVPFDFEGSARVHGCARSRGAFQHVC